MSFAPINPFGPLELADTSTPEAQAIHLRSRGYGTTAITEAVGAACIAVALLLRDL